jgi:hypothetical protein
MYKIGADIAHPPQHIDTQWRRCNMQIAGSTHNPQVWERIFDRRMPIRAGHKHRDLVATRR